MLLEFRMFHIVCYQCVFWYFFLVFVVWFNQSCIKSHFRCNCFSFVMVHNMGFVMRQTCYNVWPAKALTGRPAWSESLLSAWDFSWLKLSIKRKMAPLCRHITQDDLYLLRSENPYGRLAYMLQRYCIYLYWWNGNIENNIDFMEIWQEIQISVMF